MVDAIRGVVGQIKWSYYVAAAINGYTVAHAGGQWTLRATVVLSDAYKMSQRPLRFVAIHEKGEWRWPIEEFHITDGSLSARLGPLEE